MPLREPALRQLGIERQRHQVVNPAADVRQRDGAAVDVDQAGGLQTLGEGAEIRFEAVPKGALVIFEVQLAAIAQRARNIQCSPILRRETKLLFNRTLSGLDTPQIVFEAAAVAEDRA